jgi:predicted nucleic acid-binding protein
LTKIKKVDSLNVTAICEAINNLLTLVEVSAYYNQSPDEKDNFLFDLAIQTGGQYIITSEKALLKFMDSPVPILDIKWFKETFPVPL